MDRRARSQAGRAQWQDEVRRYDRYGPGVVGFYLDLVALVAAMVPLIVEEEVRPGVWEPSDNAHANAALAFYRSDRAEQPELVHAHVRARAGVGECWIIDARPYGWGWQIAATLTVNDRQARWTDPYGTTRDLPLDRVWRSWSPDPYEPHLAYTALCRALPNIRRLRSSVRNQQRASDSRLTTNGILAWPSPKDMPHDQAEPIVEKIIEGYIDIAERGFGDQGSVAERAPFPVHGEPPVYVEVGKEIDPTALEVETRAIEGFARDVNIPSQLLVDGPGAANHWNEMVLQDSFVGTAIKPALTPATRDITSAYLRPTLALVAARLPYLGLDPERFRVGANTDVLAQRPDNFSDLLLAWKEGLLDPQVILDHLGEQRRLLLPPGFSDFELWVTTSGVGGASNILPPTDLDEGIPEMPDPENAPDARTAATGTDWRAVLAQLQRIDDHTWGAVAATLEAGYRAAVADVARTVIRAQPPRSEERERLRALPAGRVYAEADHGLEVAALIAATVDATRRDVAAVLDDAAQRARGVLADAGAPAPTYDVDTAATVAATGLTATLTARLTAGTDDGPDASGEGLWRTARPVPDGVTSATLAAAGGAAVEAGELRRGADRVPLARDAAPWEGAMGGMATGVDTIRTVRQASGLTVGHRWVHAYWRTPMDPFEPHLHLNGATTLTPASAQTGGFFPGDHPHCTCEWVPELIDPTEV